MATPKDRFDALRKRSIQCTSIVHEYIDPDDPDDLELKELIAAEADDSAMSGPITEYWGGDGDDHWRIHVHLEARR